MSESIYPRFAGCGESFLRRMTALSTVFPVAAERRLALGSSVGCRLQDFWLSIRLAWRAVWEHGRPVLFLALSCLGVALAFLLVSAELSLVFVSAAAAALAVFYGMATRDSSRSSGKREPCGRVMNVHVRTDGSKSIS